MSERRGGGGSELTQQIVTDLLLFITVNMYRRKHINVFI